MLAVTLGTILLTTLVVAIPTSEPPSVSTSSVDLKSSEPAWTSPSGVPLSITGHDANDSTRLTRASSNGNVSTVGIDTSTGRRLVKQHFLPAMLVAIFVMALIICCFVSQLNSVVDEAPFFSGLTTNTYIVSAHYPRQTASIIANEDFVSLGTLQWNEPMTGHRPLLATTQVVVNLKDINGRKYLDEEDGGQLQAIDRHYEIDLD